MERIVLRHLSGSKTNQVEEFPLSHFNELSIGRDPSAIVKYDPERDDLVGRQHAKIARDTADPNVFSISDLGSRNGTFLNKQRIIGTARVNPGDIIQLGAGGPEFQFDVEPRPAGMVRPTRVASEAATLVPPSATPPTRVAGATPVATAAAATAGTRVGKATVERMITQQKSESRKWIVMAVGAVLVLLFVVVAAAGIIYWRDYREKQRERQQAQLAGAKTAEELNRLGVKTAGMTPGEIAKMADPATVYVQVSWRLIDRSGSPLFFLFIPNKDRDQQGRITQMVPNGPDYLMVWYYLKQNDKFEPVLTKDGRGPDGVALPPVSAAGSGSGFCVTNDGFIITNAHVAAGWKVSYSFPQNLVAVFVDEQKNLIRGQNGRAIAADVNRIPEWVPAGTTQFGQSQLGQPAVEGQNEVLNVTFQKNENRIKADLVRVSDRHDVALIKISIPSGVTKLDLHDNYDTISQGDPVTVLGYPGGSPQLIGSVGHAAPGGGYMPQQVGVIPDPTLSVGNIARVVRGQEPLPGKDPLTGKDRVIAATFGDWYQLTINTTGHGNSGGPVLDDHGQVIAVFTYGWGDPNDFRYTGAVPIRYAQELMGVAPIMK